MSFLKKLTQDFEGLSTSFKDDKREAKYEHESSGRRDYDPSGYQQYPDQHGWQQSSQGYQQGHPTSGPPPGQYPPPVHGGYGAPPPGQYGSSAPPPMPDTLPPLPSGWVAQYDDNYRHWFYVEQVSGRPQWERPLPPGYPATSGHHDSRAGSYGDSAHGEPHRVTSSYQEYHGGEYGKEKKKSSKGGMLLGAAGGAAAGLVGGALLADGLHDSDEEHHGYGHSGHGYGEYRQDSYQNQPILRTHHSGGDNDYGSDHESLQEAKEDYEEAIEEAHDSDAGSSEQEELEEAREEYEEEYGEEYEDE